MCTFWPPLSLFFGGGFLTSFICSFLATFFQTHLLFDRLFSEPFIIWPPFFRAIYFLTSFFQSQTFLSIHLRWPSTGLPHNLKKIKTMHTIQSKTLLHWGMMFNSQGKFHLHTSLQISSCFSILHVHTGTANSRKAWKYKNISRNNWNFKRTHFASYFIVKFKHFIVLTLNPYSQQLWKSILFWFFREPNFSTLHSILIFEDSLESPFSALWYGWINFFCTWSVA